MPLRTVSIEVLNLERRVNDNLRAENDKLRDELRGLMMFSSQNDKEEGEFRNRLVIDGLSSRARELQAEVDKLRAEVDRLTAELKHERQRLEYLKVLITEASRIFL